MDLQSVVTHTPPILGSGTVQRRYRTQSAMHRAASSSGTSGLKTKSRSRESAKSATTVPAAGEPNSYVGSVPHHDAPVDT